MSSISDVIFREYNNFRGVDFSNSVVKSYRSPFIKNMWKNYEDSNGTCIETRPGMKLLGNFGNQIFGLFFYKILSEIRVIVHTGTKLYEWNNYPNSPVEKTLLYENLNPNYSSGYTYNNIFYFKDGINYLEYDGSICKKVEATIPITSIGKKPTGEIINDDNDVIYQKVNVLTPKRKNGFVADGKSTKYYLDTTNLDSASIFTLTATVNGITKVETLDFSVDREEGTITFFEAPAAPIETGESNVFITFSKTNNDYVDRIQKCTIFSIFDNRLFFSGNQDYPNTVFYSELDDPRYVADTNYSMCGLDFANIKTLIPGNNVLWVLKENHQNNASIFYLTPTIDSTYGKLYPSVSGQVDLGCVSKGINFNDDIVYFSKRGLEGIDGNIYSDKMINHRSSLVDSKMVNEIDYSNVQLSEYKGYLFCLINSKIYLADSKQLFTNEDHNEYEWYYFELKNNINFMTEYDNNLYFGNSDGNIYKFFGDKDDNEDIESVFITSKEDFGYPAYLKTTNKLGNTVSLKKQNNDTIKLFTIVDGVEKEKLILSDVKGYAPFKIKDKKFKEIQLKFSSLNKMGIYKCTLQGFIAGYIKR